MYHTDKKPTFGHQVAKLCCIIFYIQVITTSKKDVSKSPMKDNNKRQCTAKLNIDEAVSAEVFEFNQ